MRTIGLLGIFLIMLGCLGCNHNEAAGRLRFWQPVSGEADQVSERLEVSLRHDFDSAQNAADVARLKVLADSIEKTDDGRIASLLKARVLYWRSYGEYMAGSDSLMRLYADSAFNIINRLTANGNEAPELNYDRARIMEVYALTLPHDTLRARMYGSALREFKAAGDSLHLSITYGRIGTMMSAMSNLREGQNIL